MKCLETGNFAALRVSTETTLVQHLVSELAILESFVSRLDGTKDGRKQDLAPCLPSASLIASCLSMRLSLSRGAIPGPSLPHSLGARTWRRKSQVAGGGGATQGGDGVKDLGTTPSLAARNTVAIPLDSMESSHVKLRLQSPAIEPLYPDTLGDPTAETRDLPRHLSSATVSLKSDGHGGPARDSSTAAGSASPSSGGLAASGDASREPTSKEAALHAARAVLACNKLLVSAHSELQMSEMDAVLACCTIGMECLCEGATQELVEEASSDDEWVDLCLQACQSVVNGRIYYQARAISASKRRARMAMQAAWRQSALRVACRLGRVSSKCARTLRISRGQLVTTALARTCFASANASALSTDRSGPDAAAAADGLRGSGSGRLSREDGGRGNGSQPSTGDGRSPDESAQPRSEG